MIAHLRALRDETTAAQCTHGVAPESRSAHRSRETDEPEGDA